MFVGYVQQMARRKGTMERGGDEWPVLTIARETAAVLTRSANLLRCATRATVTTRTEQRHAQLQAGGKGRRERTNASGTNCPSPL